MDEFSHIDVDRIMTNQLRMEVGVISLNRPNALNALDSSMIQGLKSVLKKWAYDDRIELIIIKGKGQRAYCAGGDIKALHDAGNVQFLADEYRLDFALHDYPKPIVHLMHGYVMGGGVGLMSTGRLKICTHDAEFAMPETAIGFFPDVGVRHQLARMPLGLGAWFGMTGARMKPQLAKALGLVDCILPPQDRSLMIVRLYEFISKWSRRDGELVDCLRQWVEKSMVEYQKEEGIPPSPPAPADQEYDPILDTIPKAIRDWCDFYWDYPHIPWVEDLLSNAKHFHNACEDLFLMSPRGIDAVSPLSLCVTDILLRRAKDQSLEQVFNEDYWAAAKLYKEGDLREGVCAKVIDKREPNWQYDFDDINQAVRQAYTPPDMMAQVLRQKIRWDE